MDISDTTLLEKLRSDSLLLKNQIEDPLLNGEDAWLNAFIKTVLSLSSEMTMAAEIKESEGVKTETFKAFCIVDRLKIQW